MKSIIKREWMRLFKQPKLIFTTFIMPCVLIFFVLGFFLSGVLTGKTQKMVVITESSQVKEFIAQNEIYREVMVFDQWNDEVESLYEKGKVGVVVNVETESRKAQIQYDSTKLSSEDLWTEAQDFINDLSMYIQSEELYEQYTDHRLDIVEQDRSTPVEKESARFKWYVSIFVAVLIFLVGQPLASFAVDSYVGEKERGTYDSIRLSGVEIFRFILGKTVFVVSVGLIAGALQMTSIMLSIWKFKGSLGVEHYVNNTFMTILTVILVGCISLAILVAVLIYISTYFERVRDAATYATIGTLVFTLLSQLSNVFDGDILNYIPLVNINHLVWQNAHGAANILPMIGSVILGILIVALVTQMSVLKLKTMEN